MTEQIELLDRRIAEKAGGLIVVGRVRCTSPVDHVRRDGRGTKSLKALFWNILESHRHAADTGSVAESAAAVEFTEAGRQARFCWLGELGRCSVHDSGPGSTAFMTRSRFRDWKPAATLYAQLDWERPALTTSGRLLAEQIYVPAGRVVYLGSGELWAGAVSPFLFVNGPIPRS